MQSSVVLLFPVPEPGTDRTAFKHPQSAVSSSKRGSEGPAEPTRTLPNLPALERIVLRQTSNKSLALPSISGNLPLHPLLACLLLLLLSLIYRSSPPNSRLSQRGRASPRPDFNSILPPPYNSSSTASFGATRSSPRRPCLSTLDPLQA